MVQKREVNFSIKKHILFYEFEKLWLILSILNFISVFLIIRGSTIPLVCDNAILYCLFYSNEKGDKTLYNIAVSYFAAYVFYIIQVYYPEYQRTKRALINIWLQVLNLINQTYMFLFVWDTFTKKKTPNDGTILDVNTNKIYYKNSSGLVSKADKEELHNIAERIKGDYDEIINDATFQFADNALRQLIMEKNIPQFIYGLYKTLISAEILSKTESSTILETYSNDDVDDIKKRLKTLQKLFGLEIDDIYEVTTDVDDIKQREDIDIMATQVILENYEYFSKLHKSKDDNLKQ